MSEPGQQIDRPILLSENPADRISRSYKAIAEATAALTQLMGVSRNPDNVARLETVGRSLGTVLANLKGLSADYRILLDHLPAEPEFTAASMVRASEESEAAPRAVVRAIFGTQGSMDLFGAGDQTLAGAGAGEVSKLPSRTVAQAPKRDTEEQTAIVACNAKSVAVSALAGTGKTSTLISYAKARPRLRLVYVAFNKSVAEEAQRRFPGNVKARTSHSLAFAQCGRKYSKKLGLPRAREVLELLDTKLRLPVDSSHDRYLFAQCALNRLKEFFASGSMEDEVPLKGTPEFYPMPSGIKVPGRLVVDAARFLWAAMLDVDNLGVQLPHDGYLKLYQLSEPDLSRQFDGVLLDEGQDTNPAVLSLVESQDIIKLLVGDANQSIYQFRGAMNAMGKLKDASHFALTTSFRFGENIASVANGILSVFCGETLRLKGAGGKGGPDKPTEAHLYRTNAGLFSGAVGWILSQGREMAGASDRTLQGLPSEPVTGLHFVGGVDGYQFDLIADAWHLLDGEVELIADPFLKKFDNFEQLEAYAEAVDDKELLARIGIVETYGEMIPELVAKVKAAHVPASRASLEMTSGHKSKGLEWDTVQLGNDFPALLNDWGLPRTRAYAGDKVDPESLLDLQEANLYYVAATRAKLELIPNEALKSFNEWCAANPGQLMPTPVGAHETGDARPWG